MSMSMTVVGFRAADDRWRKMKAAWDACAAVGVAPPPEVGEFFGGEDPGDAQGMEVDILDRGAKKWSDEYREGYEVDIQALPDGVRFLRFYCSW
jgi:hypothetical protein